MTNTSRIKILSCLYFLLGIQLSIYDFTTRIDFQEYGTSVSSIGLKTSFIISIWYMKFIPALFSDLVGFRGYHRKPHIIAANFVAIIMCFVLSSEMIKETDYIIGLFVLNVCICTMDVNYDGCMVEDMRDSEDKEKTMTRIQLIRAFGDICGNIFGPLLWKKYGSSGVYMTTAIISVLSLVCAIRFTDYPRDDKIKNTYSVGNTELDLQTHGNAAVSTFDITTNEFVPEKKQKITLCYLLCTIGKTLSNSSLRNLLFFNFLINLSPSTSLTMFYYLKDELGITPTYMSILGGMVSSSRILAILLFVYLRKTKMRLLYIYTSLLTVFVSLFPLFISMKVPEVFVDNSTIYDDEDIVGISLRLYTLANHTIPVTDLFGLGSFWCYSGSEVLTIFADVIRDLPPTIIAAAICDKVVDASAFSTVTSLLNIFSGLKGVIESAINSLLGLNHQHYDNLPILILIAMICEVIGLSLSCCVIPNLSMEDVTDPKDTFDKLETVETTNEEPIRFSNEEHVVPIVPSLHFEEQWKKTTDKRMIDKQTNKS